MLMEQEGGNLSQYIKRMVVVSLFFIGFRILSVLLVLYVVKPVYLVSGKKILQLMFYSVDVLQKFVFYVDLVWIVLFVLAFVVNFLLEFILWQDFNIVNPVIDIKKLTAPFIVIISRHDRAYSFLVVWWIFLLAMLGIIIHDILVYNLTPWLGILPGLIIIILVFIIAKIIKYKSQLILLYNRSNDQR